MNIARLIEVDGAPIIIIYAKKHGTHDYTTIEETGRCYRYEKESMPAPADIPLWLTQKLQREFGALITARRWDDSSIEIQRIVGKTPVAAAARRSTDAYDLSHGTPGP